jgi:hypothetical protein
MVSYTAFQSQRRSFYDGSTVTFLNLLRVGVVVKKEGRRWCLDFRGAPPSFAHDLRFSRERTPAMAPETWRTHAAILTTESGILFLIGETMVLSRDWICTSRTPWAFTIYFPQILLSEARNNNVSPASRCETPRCGTRIENRMKEMKQSTCIEVENFTCRRSRQCTLCSAALGLRLSRTRQKSTIGEASCIISPIGAEFRPALTAPPSSCGARTRGGRAGR